MKQRHDKKLYNYFKKSCELKNNYNLKSNKLVFFSKFHHNITF